MSIRRNPASSEKYFNLAVRRFIKVALLSAAALVAGGAIALSVYIDREASGPELKPRIEAAASEFLGRPLTIDELSWRPWPNAILIGTNVRLYEDPQKKYLLADAPVVEARVALLSVFKLAAGITELRLVSPRISLRRDKAGEWNAVRIADEIAARPDEPKRRWGALAFNWFVIEGGTLTVEDHAGPFSALGPIGIRGSGKLRFGRRHLHFPFELDGRLERSAAQVEIKGDLGGHSRVSVSVKGGAPSLARLAWPPAASWTGRWDGSLSYDEHPPERWGLSVRAAPLVVSTAAPRLDLLELTADYFVPSASSTFAVVARSSTTQIEAHGSTKNGALDIDVKSPMADISTLWAFTGFAGAVAAAAAPPKPAKKVRSAIAPPPRLKASISADDLRYGSTDLRGVSAVVSRSTGPYLLEHLTLQSLGGSIEASGSYLPSGGDDALTLAWKTSGVNVQDLFHLLGSTRDAGGVADSEGSLVTGLGERFLPAMNGSVKLDIKNGWTAMPGLLKVLSRLNLSTLFSEAIGHHRQRVPFDEAHAAVTVVKGKVSSDKPIVLKNKTLEMAFMGTYDLPSRAIDGKLVVNFLTVTDEIIGLIPGVREILLGKEKGMIPIWVSVKGKGDNPDVDILSVRTVAGPFWNTIKHVLRLPKTLFEELKPPAAR